MNLDFILTNDGSVVRVGEQFLHIGGSEVKKCRLVKVHTEEGMLHIRADIYPKEFLNDYFIPSIRETFICKIGDEGAKFLKGWKIGA